MRTDRLWRWGVFAALTVLAAGVWHAQLAPALAQVGPSGGGSSTSVVYLDFDRVLQQLQEKGDREAELRAFEESGNAELDRQLADVRAAEEELKILPPGSAEFDQAELRLFELGTAYEIKKRWLKSQGDKKTKERQVDLFNKITDAVARYAEREGVDIVVSDDQAVTLNKQMTFNDIQLFLVTKRIVWARDSFDITDDIATMMNNEYRAAARRP